MTTGQSNAGENDEHTGTSDARVDGVGRRALSDGGDGARGDVRHRGEHDRGVIRLHPVKLPSAPAAETAVLLGMLERAANDPAYSIERMERVFALYEQAAARSARSAFIEAMMAAKAELPKVIKTGTASYKDKGTKEDVTAFRYARWEEVCQQIESVLAKHGLILTFTTEQPAADRVSITGVLSHRDGHSERAQMALGCDASGGKNNAQGWGSSISYGKRYTSFALLNLVGHDDKDTDAATPPAETISDDQQIELRDLLIATESDEALFCKYFGIAKLADLPVKEVERAKTAISKKRK